MNKPTGLKADSDFIIESTYFLQVVIPFDHVGIVCHFCLNKHWAHGEDFHIARLLMQFYPK